MAGKPTYEELEQRVKELEKENLDRTKMERDLRIFKTAVESSINAIGITDLEGKLIYVNDSCVKMWGFNSEDEVLGRFLPEFWEGDGVIKTVKELREKGVASGEDVGKKKDGSLFFVQFTASIFKDAAGNPTLMFGSFFDITERKEIEEALRGSEACYRAVVESQTEMICRFLPDGTITFVNDAYCHYFDKDRKELIGHKFMPFIPESDRDKVFKNIASLNPNTPIITHEHRVLNPNGEICWHKWTNQAIFDDHNNLLEYQAVGWDITKRYRAEKALRESENRYRRLVETMNDGIGIQDENGLITYVNNKFCQMLNYKSDDFIGKPVTHFLDDHNSQMLKSQTSIRKKGKVTPYEIEWICKDGRKIQTIMSPQAIFDDNGQFKGSFSVITDISIRKRAERALHKAKNELERRVKERTRELKIKTNSLEEINTAMKVLLKKREEDKTELEDNVLTNVKELVEPYFEKIKKTKLDDQQETFLSIIESNLNEIISPFTRKMSLKYLNLTPTEIRIANLIKHGSPSKKIAELLNVSPRTIDTHRKNIRRKIGLQGQRGNLRSHLLSLH